MIDPRLEEIFRVWDEYQREPIGPEKKELQRRFHQVVDEFLSRWTPTLNRWDFIHYNKEAFRQWKKYQK